MKVLLYTTPWCPFCVRARQLLEQKGIGHENIDVSRDPLKKQEMMQASGRHTVPQIWINEKHIGGCDELFALERSGELDRMIESEQGNDHE